MTECFKSMIIVESSLLPANDVCWDESCTGVAGCMCYVKRALDTYTGT